MVKVLSPKKSGVLGFIRTRSITFKLILVISIVSIFSLIFQNLLPKIFEYFALNSGNIFDRYYIWTLFTHLFLHADLVHLLVNMFSLYFIGSTVEFIIGKKRYISFFFISGIFAGIVFSVFALLGDYGILTNIFGDKLDSAVGASGALFGLLGILAVLLPRKKVQLIVGPIIIIVLSVLLSSIGDSYPAFETFTSVLSIVLNILMFVMIFSLFSPGSNFYKLSIPVEMSLWMAPIIAIVPLVIISYFFPLPIGNTAHFGGLIAGLIYGWYLRHRYKKKTALLQQVFR